MEWSDVKLCVWAIVMEFITVVMEFITVVMEFITEEFDVPLSMSAFDIDGEDDDSLSI